MRPFYPQRGMNLHLYIYYQSTLWNRLQSRFSLLAVPWHVLVFFLTWQLHFKKHLRASTINTWWSHTCMSQGATRDKAVMFVFYIETITRGYSSWLHWTYYTVNWKDLFLVFSSLLRYYAQATSFVWRWLYGLPVCSHPYFSNICKDISLRANNNNIVQR